MSNKNPLRQTEKGEQWYQAVKRSEDSAEETSRKIGRLFGIGSVDDE
ncbi:hypothetical protein [Natrialba taiwanensis]|nr:hypothetical protein [Natrialba taiwanensis]